MSHRSSNGSAAPPGPCPLCGHELFGWIVLPQAGDAVVGVPIGERDAQRIVDRCESCGVAVERGRPVDLPAEWAAVCRPGESGTRAITIPNRASLQAWIGEVGWAAIDRYPGRLLHTPASLALLAERNGEQLEATRTPISGRAHAWMWQTLLNGLTFHANFAREVRAGRLRPAGSRGRARFWLDAVVTVLGAPLVLLVSVPLELGAAVGRRGGELEATARRPRG